MHARRVSRGVFRSRVRMNRDTDLASAGGSEPPMPPASPPVGPSEPEAPTRPEPDSPRQPDPEPRGPLPGRTEQPRRITVPDQPPFRTMEPKWRSEAGKAGRKPDTFVIVGA